MSSVVRYLTVLVLAFTWSWSHQQQWGSVANCNYELDVMFAIDGSNSMYRQNFEIEKAALASLVNSLNVGPLDIHVGVVLYSSVIQTYPLTGKKQEIVRNITNLHFPDEGTRTDMAIQTAMRYLTRGRGGNVRKMLILITDGRSTHPARTITAASAAKLSGIDIYVVGVTDAINQNELRQIASSPQAVFHSQTFQTLRSVLMSATNEACATVPPPTPDNRAFPDCSQQLDIIIAIDGSNSVYQTNFETEKAAVANLIRNLQMSQNGIHVGLVLFSGNISFHILTGSMDQVLIDLNNFQYHDDTTRTDLAIEKATDLFRNARGGSVQKVLILVTDGRATHPQRALAAAQTAKAAGISIFVLGISSAIDEQELNALASSPQQVLFSHNFQTIKVDLIRLASTVCETVTPPVTFPTAPTACNFQLDLIIAIDGSNSMFEENFNIQKSAIINLVQNLNVAYRDIHVGVILFSGDVTSEVLSGNKQQIVNAINNFQYPDDTTRTDLAIQEAVRLFSSSRGGNVPKLLIIVTDGRATFPQRALQAAQEAKNTGISITCVGVTDAINQQELRALASSPRQVFFSADFLSLQRDVIQAANEACQSVTTLPPVTSRVVCNDHLDFVVALDGSNSMYEDNFNLQKSSVANLINNMNIGPQDIFAGLVLFSGDVTSTPLTGNKQQLLRDLTSFQYPDDTTRTDLAIDESVRMLSQSTRSDTHKLLILITDGRATFHDEALRAAQNAKAQGITVYVVGVTDAINEEELRSLASAPNNVFFSNSFQDLRQDLIRATRKACYTISG